MSKSTAQIRQAFLNFFADKGHQKVSSSSLVPSDDPFHQRRHEPIQRCIPRD